MTTEFMYTYLGTNGTITTPIHLEGVPAVKKYRLRPAMGKKLTDSKIVITDFVTVEESDISKWKEI